MSQRRTQNPVRRGGGDGRPRAATVRSFTPIRDVYGMLDASALLGSSEEQSADAGGARGIARAYADSDSLGSDPYGRRDAFYGRRAAAWDDSLSTTDSRARRAASERQASIHLSDVSDYARPQQRRKIRQSAARAGDSRRYAQGVMSNADAMMGDYYIALDEETESQMRARSEQSSAMPPPAAVPSRKRTRGQADGTAKEAASEPVQVDRRFKGGVVRDPVEATAAARRAIVEYRTVKRQVLGAFDDYRRLVEEQSDEAPPRIIDRATASVRNELEACEARVSEFEAVEKMLHTLQTKSHKKRLALLRRRTKMSAVQQALATKTAELDELRNYRDRMSRILAFADEVAKVRSKTNLEDTVVYERVDISADVPALLASIGEQQVASFVVAEQRDTLRQAVQLV